MEAFAYANPSSLNEAVAALGATWDEAAVLAGGTDLISLMKQYVYSPKRVVNVKGIQDLKGIERRSDGSFRIGAAVTLDELTRHRTLSAELPALLLAARGVTSPQMRNMGTVGGDLCQRPRCWYFRNGMGLLAADPDGRSLVPGGENQYHAIFGHENRAYFVSASSFGPALVSYGAKLKLTSPAGSREVDADKFFRVPASNEEREIDLKPNEILTEIVIPPANGWKSATYEVRQREAFDWPLVAAAVALRIDGGKVNEARVTLGHVAPIPWKSEAAAKALIGKSIDEQTAADAGSAAATGASPLSQNGYKVQLVKVAVKRAILAAIG